MKQYIDKSPPLLPLPRDGTSGRSEETAEPSRLRTGWGCGEVAFPSTAWLQDGSAAMVSCFLAADAEIRRRRVPTTNQSGANLSMEEAGCGGGISGTAC
jgi:hypothetical protein